MVADVSVTELEILVVMINLSGYCIRSFVTRQQQLASLR